MVSFRGNLISPTSVIRDYNFVAVTTNYPTSFVEINPFDPSDVKALNKVKYIYGNGGADAALMSDIFQYEGKNTSNVNSRYFVLTEQEDDFSRIRPSAVLGVTKTTDIADKGVFVDMIQVNPFYVFSNPYSHLKKCGTSIIESLKTTFSNRDLWLHSPKSLVNYFKQFGFEIENFPAGNNDVLMKFTNRIKV